MITVLFFAKYREQLGTGKITISAQDVDLTTCTVAQLKNHLAGRGEIWQAVLSSENTLCAINHNIASDNHLVAVGDEVAFYPPVTGG